MSQAWRKGRWFLIGFIFVANILVWLTVIDSGPRDYLVLASLDIGQGDAIFLEDVAGHQILIDGGPGNALLSALPSVMPFHDRHIDLLIVSHPHADHIAGLVEILKRYEVDAVLDAGAIYPSAVYREWQRLIEEKGITRLVARRGERIKLAGGDVLEIIAPFQNWQDIEPKEIHDSMVVAQLWVASTSVAILTGDAEVDVESALIKAGDNLESKILKIGHHGSKTSTSEAFLTAVRPEVAIISVGDPNRYDHPSPGTLERLGQFAVPVLRTDQEGTIIFRIDSNTGEVARER